MWRMGLHPFRRLSPSPAQAGRAASTSTNRGIERSRGCARGLKLVAEVDERRLVYAFNRVGLATRPSARMVKGRRKLVRGGKAVGMVTGFGDSVPRRKLDAEERHLSMEGVLVPAKRLSLTRQRWRRSLVARRVDLVARLGLLA